MAEFGPLTCAGCALLCDDVIVSHEDDRVRVTPECPLSAAWFSERIVGPAEGPPATINDQPADVDAALVRVAELLRGARHPLIHGFDHTTVEDVRAALALADRLGAVVATDPVGSPWPGAPAAPLRGVSTATLGEIRDRSQLLVIWREDPETTHPRLLERLRFDGGGQRTVVVVDDVDTATAGHADVRLRWPPERDLEALVTLHMMIRAHPPVNVRDHDLERIYERVSEVAHAAFIYGSGLTAGAGGQRRALALHELVRALCHDRHVVTLELPRAPGTRSADDVLAWQSGYGAKIDLAAGHPELVTATEPLDDVDVTLLIESGPRGSLVSGPGVEVWIRTAAAGVEASGTAHRLDGVPLTLQTPLAGDAPTAASVLTRLLAEVQR